MSCCVCSQPLARLNNWPPLPSFCPVKPCFYQDIPVEIPADFQKTVSTMYYLWMASTIALFLNFLSSLAWFCVEPSSGSGFGLSILWALLYTPCSFVCWYRPMYKAFRSDSSFNFFVFFFVFFAQNVMYVLQAIGIPNWGFSGWILSLIALRKNTAVAVMMILVSLFFTAVAVLGIIMLKKIHSLYRRTGASFQKAQEEFAAGVFSNQAVRTAAANAATGAATNAFRVANAATGAATNAFRLALSGLVGIVSWKRPLTLVITFFTLLSVLGVMLSLAGSILSCQNAQLVKSLEACERERDSCVCCQARSEPLPASCSQQSEMLTMFPNPDCRSIRVALKDLLFSVCGLTVFSTIICTLSAVVCCIQIFSLDIVHVLVPQRSSSVTLECTSPPDTFLQSMMDFEEFVPPVPPPPYYPPEYTCSSETDAQSITYNGSMDSPVPLYPTDFPPSYETVMGLRGDSQATLFDSQLTDGSHACTCDRVPSIVLSGEVSMDSGSLIMSEIMDIPGDSSPSEDSCLLELQGSMRSVDYVLFRSIQRSRADYCLSVDCVQCSHHARSPMLGLQGPFEEMPQPRVRGERSYSCSTAEPGHDGILVGGAVTHRCHPDFREVLYTKALEDTVSNSSADTGLCSEACLLRRSHCDSPPLLRAGSAGKSKLLPSKKVTQQLSKTTTRSLGDLKVCRGTRGLVARFLQRPKRSPAAGMEVPGHSSQGHKQSSQPGGSRWDVPASAYGMLETLCSPGGPDRNEPVLNDSVPT
ncbi:PREDICTED: protein FAM189B-like [Pygoscelis adeliae]|uniref:protein FAM189B-like n=1 Tax=Pygoscelis adeliae TaxID=9238 RepID=UPI0004F4E272|nr:PREDICTED: protein FAM189B-like [Pygoscelis adeliae]